MLFSRLWSSHMVSLKHKHTVWVFPTSFAFFFLCHFLGTGRVESDFAFDLVIVILWSTYVVLGHDFWFFDLLLSWTGWRTCNDLDAREGDWLGLWEWGGGEPSISSGVLNHRYPRASHTDRRFPRLSM
jgi:hypothetical protein